MGWAQILPRLLSDHFLENVSPMGMFRDRSVKASGNTGLNLFNSRSQKELTLENLLGHPVGQFQNKANSQCLSAMHWGQWLVSIASSMRTLSLGRQSEAGPAEE